MCDVCDTSVASDGAMCCTRHSSSCMCHLSVAYQLKLQANLTLSAKITKSFSLYFGVDVQLAELLHVVTVKEIATLLLAYAKQCELDLL